MLCYDVAENFKKFLTSSGFGEIEALNKDINANSSSIGKWGFQDKKPQKGKTKIS